MIEETRHFTTDLAVIGSGLAGFAASTFALKRGISTAQAGNTGAIAYTTGYLDLYGYEQGDEPQVIVDPWAGLARLRQAQPNHPLAGIAAADIRTAFDQFTSFLGECGIAYTTPTDGNSIALTPAGTTKPTFCVPATMAEGVLALQRQARCVIVDFHGLRGFSARQVCANLKDQWPNLRAERVNFPEMNHGEIYPEVMARALEVAAHRQQLASAILAIVGDAEVVGLPAVMGMHNPDHVMAELRQLIGLPLFEIPTMPPSVPGIRLREMFEQVFPQKGLTLVPQQKVRTVDFSGAKVKLSLADNFGAITISAKAVILATGRFLSGGLEARIDGISEPLIGLPVAQPDSRDQWYNQRYLDPSGHQVHLCGIAVDDSLRPLMANGKPYDPRLFAAGIILAHQDWIRGRCGAGVAIATAFKAMDGVERLLNGNTNA